jgi:hypothetical protein
MKHWLGMILVFTSIASGQSGIYTPRLGFIRDADNVLRPVLGLPGNFVLGTAAEFPALRVAFSGRSGILKTEDSLAVFDARGEVLCRWQIPGQAAVGLSPDGSEAIAFLPDTFAVVHIRNCRAASITLDPKAFAGEVMSAAVLENKQLGLVLKRDDILWLLEVSLPLGLVHRQMPLVPASGPALLEPDGTLIFASQDGLVVRKADGTERLVEPGCAAARIEEMGNAWIHVVENAHEQSGARHLALRLLGDREELYRLPEVAP